MTHGPYTKSRQRYLIAERDHLRTINAELLAALERIANHETRGDRRRGGMVDISEVTDLQRTARAAINKAKGTDKDEDGELTTSCCGAPEHPEAPGFCSKCGEGYAS